MIWSIRNTRSSKHIGATDCKRNCQLWERLSHQCKCVKKQRLRNWSHAERSIDDRYPCRSSAKGRAQSWASKQERRLLRFQIDRESRIHSETDREALKMSSIIGLLKWFSFVNISQNRNHYQYQKRITSANSWEIGHLLINYRLKIAMNPV